MKITLFVLFLIQSLVLSFYSVFLFRGQQLHALTYEDVTIVNFIPESEEEFHFFLKVAENKGVNVSRHVFLERQHLIVSTIDTSLNGHIRLAEGRFPETGTDEFISSAQSNDERQVGMIKRISPEITVTINDIRNPQNFLLAGRYYLNTTDSRVLEEIFAILESKVYSITLEGIYTGVENALLGMMFQGMDNTQLGEFIIFSTLLLLCVLSTIIQYGMKKLKTCAILLAHGYSVRKIAWVMTKELFFSIVSALMLAYFFFLLVLWRMGYGSFSYVLSIWFWTMNTLFLFVYLLLLNGFIHYYLRKLQPNNLLKGKKPDFFLQFFNHVLKIVCITAFLFFSHFTLNNLSELGDRIRGLESWEMSENFHSPFLADGLGVLNDPAEMPVFHEKFVDFYEAMSADHNAFIMDATAIFFYDLMGADPGIPEEYLAAIHPAGPNITISPNFLDIYPIRAVNGIAIQEQLDRRDNVLNLLVPNSFKKFEEDILRLYLERFHFLRVEVDNFYRKAQGVSLNEESIEELEVKIIFVEDGQYYFSFSPAVRVESGNRVLDPIAMVYTGTIHPSSLIGYFGRAFYFHSEVLNVYEEILPLALAHGVEAFIYRRIVAVFHEYTELILSLEEQRTRLMIFFVLSLIANLGMTYHLLSGYIEKNKFKIFIKNTLGYSIWKRNEKFLQTFLLSSIGTILIIALFFGWQMFFIGIGLLFTDVLLSYIMEKRLMNKSFHTVIRGER